MSEKQLIEGTIRTLKKNAAQAAEWYGEDDHRVARIREFQAESERHLAELKKEARPSAL
jgi:hypothetical protein